MAGLEGLLAGRVLGGRYLIEEVIGRGGMGAVYRALDERLGRRVAVKVITLIGGDSDALERLRARFHREARAAAALPHHPNVVPVYDYGTDEELGLDYIVMELLRGEDLSTRLARSEPPPLSTGLRILLQAIRGVAVGHRSGLIHRDIKPGNIFLATGDDRDVQVRVVDFGIAKLVDDEDTANQLTQDGRGPHSPAFASPEQLRGLTKLTPASDVFSLGAVGFLLLTGSRPFTDADRNRMSLGMSVPTPRLRSSHPAIPTGVEAVVQKALAYDPEERYADAGAMLEALDEAIREIADTPLEPYAGVHFEPPVAPTRQRVEPSRDTGDDHTRILPEIAPEDDRTRALPGEDHTLAAPEPPAAAAGAEPAAGVPPRAVPARPPLKQPQKKNRLALVVWTLVLLALAAVAYWAFLDSGGRQAATIPPPPDRIPEVAVSEEAQGVEEPNALDAFALNQEGIRFFDAGVNDTAAMYFRMAVDVESDNADYRRNLGLVLRRLGEYEESVEHLRRALALNPGKLVTQFELAGSQLLAGDTATALANFEDFADASISRRELSVPRMQAINLIRVLRRAQAASDTSAADTADLPPLPQPESIAPVIPANGEL